MMSVDPCYFCDPSWTSTKYHLPVGTTRKYPVYTKAHAHTHTHIYIYIHIFTCTSIPWRPYLEIFFMHLVVHHNCLAPTSPSAPTSPGQFFSLFRMLIDDGIFFNFFFKWNLLSKLHKNTIMRKCWKNHFSWIKSPLTKKTHATCIFW